MDFMIASTIRGACRTKIRVVRRGAATLDYVLLMGVVMPLVVFVYWAAPRIMNLVYELTTTVMGYPFQ